jgi:hydrogenase maturation protein HypF
MPDAATALVPATVALTVPLPRPVPLTLAVGAFLKNTLCLTREREAWVSTDVGNLDTAAAVRAFEAGARDLLAAAGQPPELIAHDLHPDFHSTVYAGELAVRTGARTLPVQHHHAHVAAVMAEHGVETPTLGLALDGFGLGPNGESWGGELIRVDRRGFARLGHLAPLPQPGGDRAAREPWRMAAAALHVLGRTAEIAPRFANHPGAAVIAQMLAKRIHCPETTSCGRLFDAACGLLGVKPVAAFEGEAPMALEQLATDLRVDAGAWRLTGGVLDCRPLLARLLDRSPADGAGLFHGTLIGAMTDWVVWAVGETAISQVALSGGCFLNRVLRDGLTAELRARDINVLQPLRLKPGDTAISLGQAWVAVMAMREG